MSEAINLQHIYTNSTCGGHADARAAALSSLINRDDMSAAIENAPSLLEGLGLLNTLGKGLWAAPGLLLGKTKSIIDKTKGYFSPKMKDITAEGGMAGKFAVAEEKNAIKFGEKIAVEESAKIGTKLGVKALGKSAAELIPGACLAAGTYFAYDQYKKGDYVGAAINMTAGVVDNVPLVGTAAGMGLNAWEAKREYDQETKTSRKPIDLLASRDPNASISKNKQALLSIPVETLLQQETTKDLSKVRMDRASFI